MKKADKIEYYKKILKKAGLELKGKNNLYTSMNGHMFSFVAALKSFCLVLDS